MPSPFVLSPASALRTPNRICNGFRVPTKMINSPTMNPNPQRTEPTATLKDYVDPPAEPEISTFDPYTWQESQAQ